MANPVTKAYMHCLAWRKADIVELAGKGNYADASNADSTQSAMYRAIGQQDSLKDAAIPEKLLDEFRMIYRPPPPPPEKRREER